MRLRFVSALLFATSVVTQAQSPAPLAANPTIKTTANEVLLDMVVRDKHEKFVRDLTAQDVEVYEDGVKQQVRAFRLLEGAEVREADIRLQRELSGKDNARVNPVNDVHLVSLVFKGFSFDNRKNAFLAAQEFVHNELRSNTFIGVFILDRRLLAIQGFTNDKKLLLQAIRRATSSSKSDFSKESAAILGRLESAATTSRQIDGRIDFNSASAGLLSADVGTGAAAGILYAILKAERVRFNTISAMQEMDALLDLIDAQSQLPGRKTVVLLTPGVLVPANFMERFRHVISSANRAHVTFYGIDINFLTPQVSPAQNSISALKSLNTAPQSGVENIAADPGFKADDQLQYALHAANSQESLIELTESTGGFTVANTNDYKKHLRRIAEDIAVHYELAYAPTAAVLDGRYHQIEVKVLRPGAGVQARKGYYALPELNGRQLMPYEVPCLQAVNAPSPPAEFDFKAAALRFQSSTATVQHGLVVEVPARLMGARRDTATNGRILHVSLMAIIRGTTGEIVEKQSQEINLSIPENKYQNFAEGNIVYTQPVYLAPGDYTLQFAVADQINSKVSVKQISLAVSRANQALEISEAVWVRRLEPRKEPPEAADPFHFPGGKITPALTNGGARDQRPVLFFRIYPAETAKSRPAVSVEYLLNGSQVGADTPVLMAAGAGDPIPVLIAPHLEPGKYVARIHATQENLSADESLSFVIE